MKKSKITKVFAFVIALALLSASVAAIPVSASPYDPTKDPNPEINFPDYCWIEYGVHFIIDYDSLGEGNPIYYKPFDGIDIGEPWYIQRESNGYYSIRPQSCMDAAISVENDSSANGAKIVIKKYTASSGQQWKMEFDTSTGSYRILSRCSYFEKGITIPSKNTKNALTQTDTPDHLDVSVVTRAEHTHFFRDGECTECFKLLGDLNDDNAVTAADSTLLSRYLAKWSGLLLNLSVADMNHDGVVNSTDATLLSRYLAGWDLDLDS